MSLAVFQLKEAVRNWWAVIGRSVGGDWERFEETFHDKYILESARDRLRERFEGLRQGDMSVDDYAQEFTNLSRFATDLVAEERQQCRRFTKGLRPAIRDKVIPQRLCDFVDLLETARAIEENQEASRMERESQKGKGANTSRGDRHGQKRKSFSPDSGPEVLRRSGSVGSSMGPRCSASGRPIQCHLCGQSGHVVSQCSKLQ